MNKLEKTKIAIEELRMFRREKIHHLELSSISPLPFTIQSFIEVMNCRIIDFGEAAYLLINKKHIVPASLLIRSLFENNAITFSVLSAMNKTLETGVISNDLVDVFKKTTYGTRYNEVDKAINIMTYIDKLDKEYGMIKQFYEGFCEFAHPNWDGAQGSYCEFDIDARESSYLKVITKEHDICNFFIECFHANMNIYLDLTKKIKSGLLEFTQICDKNVL